MTRRLPALAAALALLAGCGSTDSTGEFSGDEKDVAQVVEDLQQAANDDDARTVCRSLLSSEAIQRIPGGDCTKAIDQAFEDADNFELTVDDVRVSGTRATAKVKAGRDEDQVETVELVKQGDVWKITRLAGS